MEPLLAAVAVPGTPVILGTLPWMPPGVIVPPGPPRDLIRLFMLIPYPVVYLPGSP